MGKSSERAEGSGTGAARAADRFPSAALLDAVGYGAFLLAPDGDVAAANDALTALTGYDGDALRGGSLGGFLDAEDVVRVETAIREQLLAGSRERVDLALPVFTAAGDAVACEVRVRKVTDGGEFLGTLGVVREVEDAGAAAEIRDVGERRQAFDALAEASADGIIMLDDDSVIRYANPAVERILGYAPEELVGGSKMRIIPERLREVHAEALQRYLETSEKHIDWTYVELPGQHRDGHEVPLAISLNEFTHDGEHYFVGTFRDISDRKAVEDELERQNERLQRFASMLAHEIRNPLQVAQIYLDFVDDDEGTSVDRIAESLEQIDEIIEVLLMLAQGDDEIECRETVALAEVAADAWANTETGCAEFDLSTSRRFRVNPTHLQQLLENLFRNAVEHGSTSPRSQARGDAADEPITVRVGPLDGGFFVEDTGSGIPVPDREQVVEAGYTTDEDGIGLGLTFVAELADAYGWGFAIVESDEGGARFEFTGVETVADE
ncbi:MULTISPECIES: PAS domain S-box protein [Halorussus]|uniref:PAS domain S-box protein n=1 Tax=Halorussus TaxID=1070314 RepID=UPI000E20EEBE|nr:MULTISPECIES: PAS domain S-box protein [Halorussus]NHN61445.1 PAS domain S-box protein [Halorussus sp. JP-T4]